MAKREDRILKFTKLGFLMAVVAAVFAAMAFFGIAKKFNAAEMMIVAGTKMKPIIMLSCALAIVLGFPAFLLSLQGAASLEGAGKKQGWLGFWIGTAATAAGLVLGVLFWFMKM